MSAELLKGAAVAAALDEKNVERVEKLKSRGITPCLAIVRVGERDDDLSYERGAMKRCAKLGIEVKNCVLPIDAQQSELIELLRQLNDDGTVHGVLLFRPLPKHMDEAAMCSLIEPGKDIDCMNELTFASVCCNSGKGFAPCTAAGVMAILDHYYGRDFCRGKRAAVIGRSKVVGLPAAMMLMARNATVTICHSATVNAPEICREADIVVVACGNTDSIGKEYFTPGQVVIDVGIGWSEEKGRLCGDVKTEEILDTVAAVTPVPGGAGAVTTAVLANQLIDAAENGAS